MEPSGQFAYITAVEPPQNAIAQAGIYAYSIDTTTGALTLVPGRRFCCGAIHSCFHCHGHH